MAKKTNTTESIAQGKQITASSLDAERKRAAKVLKDEKQVEVQIPKYLEKRLGKNVPVAVNGAVIHVPVGEKVKIPESMSKVLNQKLQNLKL